MMASKAVPVVNLIPTFELVSFISNFLAGLIEPIPTLPVRK